MKMTGDIIAGAYCIHPEAAQDGPMQYAPAGANVTRHLKLDRTLSPICIVNYTMFGKFFKLSPGFGKIIFSVPVRSADSVYLLIRVLCQKYCVACILRMQ